MGCGVRVSHRYRTTVDGEVVGLAHGGFRLRLHGPCRTRLSDYQEGDVVFYGWLNTLTVEKLGRRAV